MGAGKGEGKRLSCWAGTHSLQADCLACGCDLEGWLNMAGRECSRLTLASPISANVGELDLPGCGGVGELAAPCTVLHLNEETSTWHTADSCSFVTPVAQRSHRRL